MEKQVVLIYAATNGYLDGYPVSQALRYEKELYTFLDTNHPGAAQGDRGEEGPQG